MVPIFLMRQYEGASVRYLMHAALAPQSRLVLVLPCRPLPAAPLSRQLLCQTRPQTMPDVWCSSTSSCSPTAATAVVQLAASTPDTSHLGFKDCSGLPFVPYVVWCLLDSAWGLEQTELLLHHQACGAVSGVHCLLVLHKTAWLYQQPGQ